MPHSADSHLTFWDFSFTNLSIWTFKGLFFILWLSLCLLAECEGTKEVPVSTVTLLEENYRSKAEIASKWKEPAKPFINPRKFWILTVDVKVTFDPNTAYPWLAVSPEWTYVESRDTPQEVPDNPERFNSTPAVLGLPGFTYGRYYWEVEYGSQNNWGMGLALERVDRKAHLELVPEEGIWQLDHKQFQAVKNDPPTLRVRPGIIQFYVNYESGEMTFAIEGKLISKTGSFKGEKVFPFFYVGEGGHFRSIIPY